MPSYIGPCWDAIFVLRRSLLAVVERELKRVYGEDGWWDRVATRFSKERQVQLKEMFESRRKNLLAPLKGDEKEILDITDLHKIIESEWGKVFKHAWSKSPLNWLQEVIDLRNPLAHPTSAGIPKDAAIRLLQDSTLILKDVDQDAAKEIEYIRAAMDREDGDTIDPWYAHARPHQDIREGRLDESVFAADVWAVYQGTAADVYKDCEQFFAKTCVTSGLKLVLKRVARALKGSAESGDRIISLQTAFGGGKTHILIALLHLARESKKLLSSPEAADLRNALGSDFPDTPCGVAVFTNKTCDVIQGRKTPDDIHTRTLWGDLAAQLGGLALYEMVRPNDENRTVPQGIFTEVIRKASPCLILIDELADYCTGAAAVAVGASTLADQTISFMQQLTEAVQQVPGAVLVATLPASKFEVAQSEKGQEIFTTLERRYGRLAADIKPVADDEIYEVVRTRLFESIERPSSPEYHKKVASSYFKMYSDHSNEVPSDGSKSAYREQLERAYPFHPLLIDTFYTRWGSHSDFQRTRGVLRLLASIIADLWVRRDTNTQSQHFIQPCHVQWSLDPLQAALTRLWGQGFQSVSAGDVSGEKSNAHMIDEDLGGDYSRERISQGLAAAILLGSFGGKGERSGFSTRELKLASSRMGLNWNYADGALAQLDDRSHYLRTVSAGSYGKRYWYNTKPNLNRLVLKYRQQAERQNFDSDATEMLRDLTRREPGGEATWRVVVDPGLELPEQKSLTLILLPPSFAYGEEALSQESIKDKILEISKKCGSKDRNYRNTLVFLGPSVRGLTKLYQLFRERFALKSVQSDYSDQLDYEQLTDLTNRLNLAEKAVLEAIGPAYTAAFRVDGQEVVGLTLADARSSFAEHLAFLWKILIEEEEWILRRLGTVALQKTGLIPESDGIRIKDAVDAFLRYTDKPIVARKEAVTTGLQKACLDGLVGIGRGASLSHLTSKSCRQAVELDPLEEGVWIIPAFDPASQMPAPPLPSTPPTAETVRSEPASTEPEAPPVEPATGQVRKITIRGSVAMENYSELFRCFISPAARMNLRKLDLGIEFVLETQIDKPIREDDPALKAMKEAAAQLGLRIDIED